MRLEVRDWGRGFRPSGVRGNAGPGETVGLSSMRDRVALLNGSLQIRSEPGLGTSVVAEIPLPAAGEGGDRRRRVRVNQGRGAMPARILIADDHELVRDGIKHMLGYEEDLEVVGEASNGREAVELCRRLKPDLVLMDVRMPEMDGVGCYSRYKGGAALRECARC